MSTSISAKLMYGWNYQELIQHLSDDLLEQLDEDIDYGIIDSASPWYDSDRKDWIIGEWILVNSLSTNDLLQRLQESPWSPENGELVYKLSEILQPRFYVTPDVT